MFVTNTNDVFNEGSSGSITLTFTDADGNAATPLTANYAIHCQSNDGQEVRAATAISGLGPSTEVAIEAADTVIIDQAHKWEIRVITINATDATGKPVTAQFYYRVKNLHEVG